MLIGLSALSFSYRCGLVGRGTPRVVARPLGVEDIVALAARAGLRSVELPFALLPDTSPEGLATLRQQLEACSLSVVLDTDVVDVVTLEAAIAAAAALGANVVRTLASPVLEGNRGAFARDWGVYLDSVVERLRAVRPTAEAHGVAIAIENHQDLTSDELLLIVHAVGGDCIGVTFDPVNAYVVAEDPFAVLPRVAPYVRNIHIADFLTYPSREGWRLVRCALGEGDINLRRLIEQVELLAPQVPCQIELVSHSARHVRLFSDSWWHGYPPRDVRSVIPAMREFAAPSRSFDDDWRTPWERGAAEGQISFYEDQQFASSVSYLRTIGILPRL